MKKLLALLAALAIIFALAGCNGGKTTSSDPAESDVDVQIWDGNTDTVSTTTEADATTTTTADANEPATTTAAKPTTTKAPTTTTTKPAPTTTVHVHSFAPASCTTPKKCACGATEGSALGHKYSAGKCSVCGAKDPDYITLLDSSSYGTYSCYIEDPDKGALEVYSVTWKGGSNVTYSLTLYDPVDAANSKIQYNGTHYGYPNELYSFAAQNVKVTATALDFEIHNNGGVYKHPFTFENKALIYQGEDEWIGKGNAFKK